MAAKKTEARLGFCIKSEKEVKKVVTVEEDFHITTRIETDVDSVYLVILLTPDDGITENYCELGYIDLRTGKWHEADIAYEENILKWFGLQDDCDDCGDC